MTISTRILFALALLAVPACGDSDPANVAGSYTISVTSRANGCQFANWTEGNVTQGIPMVITQVDAAMTATFQGGTASFLDFVFGTHVMTGEVSGNAYQATLFGMRQLTMGSCSYTINGTMTGSLAGDAISGTIDYTSKTNGHPDCTSMMIEGCHSIQAFNGTRPPPAQ